jgi:hypothetical protein
MSITMATVFFTVFFLPAYPWQFTNGETVFFSFFHKRGFAQKKKSFCPCINIHHRKPQSGYMLFLCYCHAYPNRNKLHGVSVTTYKKCKKHLVERELKQNPEIWRMVDY